MNRPTLSYDVLYQEALAPLTEAYGDEIQASLFEDAFLDCVVFAPGDDPVPHWFLVTRGLALQQNADTPTVELTLRVPKTEEQTEPPEWAFTVLHHLSRPCTGDMLEDQILVDSPLRNVAYRSDPLLASFELPRGERVDFRQAVGLTVMEALGAIQGDPEIYAELVAEQVPLGLLDPERACLSEQLEEAFCERCRTEQPLRGVDHIIRPGVEVEFRDEVPWLLLADDAFSDFFALFQAAIPDKQSFWVASDEVTVYMCGGEEFGWKPMEDLPDCYAFFFPPDQAQLILDTVAAENDTSDHIQCDFGSFGIETTGPLEPDFSYDD